MDGMPSQRTRRSPIPYVHDNAPSFICTAGFQNCYGTVTLVCFSFFSFFKKKIYLFIYFWLHWVFVAARGLSLQLWQVGAALYCGAQPSHCDGFSCCGAWALGARASVVVACGLSSCGSRALERRLSSCGTRAQLLHGTWDLPGPGIEPVSPALAGGLLTTAPPGKPSFPFKQKKKLWLS